LIAPIDLCPCCQRPRKTHLTVREFQVYELTVRGLTNREMADELCVAIVTIKYHLNNIYRKINVTSRYELMTKGDK
jgi:DNA-binding CsgD family transcriptional regulator